MSVKIGIPRALLFYNYYPLWKSFFENLGAEIVTSGPTTKSILQEGLKLSVDEACLPVKAAFGHVAALRDRADYIFIPRLVSIFPREYICPKFLGFPDMVARCIQGLPAVIDYNINLYKSEKDLYRQFYEIGSIICSNPLKIAMAYKRAIKEMKIFNLRVESGILPEKAFSPCGTGEEAENRRNSAVAVVGHPYNIYDSYINFGLLKRLEESGINVVTPDNVPENVVNRYAGVLHKKLFWTLGRRMVGSAYYFLDNPDIKGLIHVASFACGPDSMTGELIERRIRRSSGMPFLSLTLDEHTGEAGIITRIEAFFDMAGMSVQPQAKKIIERNSPA